MILLQVLKAKLHHARLTYTNPDYVGSIEIDADLMKQAGILDGELVHVWAVDHQARIITYAFSGPTGVIGMNGGAAHHFNRSDRVIIAAFAMTDEIITPKMVLLDEWNRVVRDMTPFATEG